MGGSAWAPRVRKLNGEFGFWGFWLGAGLALE